MFESLNAEGPKDAMRYATSLAVSIVAHTVVLGILVILPMLFFNVVQAGDVIGILIEPPSIPVPPPLPATPVARHSSDRPQIYNGGKDWVPERLPIGVLPEPEPQDVVGLDSIVRGIGNFATAPASGSPIGAILELKKPIDLPKPPPPIIRTPVRVSGPIQDGKLIHKVIPIYPELAIRTRVSGTVRLEAIIDEDGNVTSLKVLDGHPLLREAALAAVRQWKYMPTLIGGEPVPVMAMVSVVFRIR